MKNGYGFEDIETNVKEVHKAERLLTSQMTRVLSSCPPREARYLSSKEKERLWMRTLWSLSLWTIWRVSKSQMIMSA
jgi:hypothetical protein